MWNSPKKRLLSNVILYLEAFFLSSMEVKMSCNKKIRASEQNASEQMGQVAFQYIFPMIYRPQGLWQANPVI